MRTLLFKPLQAIYALVLILALASLPSKAAEGDWILQSEASGVKAYYKVAGCEGQQVVFLKFVNSNNYEVKIAWEQQIKHAGDVITKYPASFRPFIFVKTGEVAGTKCMGELNLQLVARLKPGTTPSIEEFNFLNLEVTRK